ncbi:DUF4376 domain-containing protein [Salmonella enterica]
MATVKDAKNARYNENGTISVQVLFSDSTEADGKTPKYLPFTASENDYEAHGRQLFADLKAGKYGPVEPWVVTPEMLAEARTAKHEKINYWRNVQESANYVFTFNGHNWDYSRATQERMAIAVMMAKAGKLPDDFIWTDADNNDVPMTAGELLGLSDAIDQVMFMKGLQIHMRQRTMKEELEALSTLDAVRNYVIGWPEGNPQETKK